MLNILPIIPSSTSQKITHYSYFILKSLLIILIINYFASIFQVHIDIYRNKNSVLLEIYCAHFSVIQVKWSMKVILGFS